MKASHLKVNEKLKRFPSWENELSIEHKAGAVSLAPLSFKETKILIRFNLKCINVLLLQISNAQNYSLSLGSILKNFFKFRKRL